MKKRPKIPIGDSGSTTFGPGVSANGLVVTGLVCILSTLQQNQNMNGNLSLKIIWASLALVHQTSCCLLYHCFA